jgi:uncharacterized protein HemX
MSAHVDAINEALNRLLAQDSWEAPYVMAAKDALAALAVVERERDTLRAALDRIAKAQDRYYDPPDPPDPCCAEGEDDESHDVQACLDDQAEAAAEAKAERMREDRMDAEWERERRGW